jgi:NAD(P)-dependent dehydrogenase (short-subunit alcohol dehydrogenase family)
VAIRGIAVSLADKVAIVTGGAGALGQAVIVKFLEEDALVAATDRNAKRLEALRADLTPGARDRFFGVSVDVTVEESVRGLVADVAAQAGGLDILVNVVGAYTAGDLLATEEATWDQMLVVNLKSVYLCCRAALPAMIEGGGGRIINVAARSVVPPSGGAMAYTVAKSGVIALTQALAQEVRRHNITVNAVLPSTMDTWATRKAMPDADTSTWVTPESVARAIVFLASDAAASITGTLLAI